MRTLSEAITGGLVALFSAPGSALAIASLMLLSCAGILIWVRFWRVAPLQQAAEERIWRLGGGGLMPRRGRVGEPEAAPIETIMEQPGRRTEALRAAWARYARTRRGFGSKVRTTGSAAAFLTGAGAETAVLGWWANIFVAVGLVFTFLGVVAALTTATASIGSAGDPVTTQAALADLLTITATKFWTSIAGVGSSILLRVYERRWRTSLERSQALLADQLDRLAEPLETTELLARQVELLEGIAVKLGGPVPAPEAQP